MSRSDDELVPQEDGTPRTPFTDPRQLELGIRFIKNQEKQLDLEEKRLEQEGLNVNQAFSFSREALVVEANDRKDARKRRNQLTIFSAVIFAILVLVLAFMEKDQLLHDLAKLGAGVALGYGWRATKGKNGDDGSTPPAPVA